jgi:anti-repressor protein
MADLQIFRNESFGEIRTLNIDGEPWFVGKDVAEILGYTNPQKAIRDHIDEEDKTLNESFTVNGTKGILINESGLYSLILSSKLPSAKQFKRWVTNEVLPSIRKHGVYATAETAERLLNDPDFMIRTFTALKEEREKNAALQSKIEQDKPKVLFADAVSTAKTSILVGELAKLLKQNGVEIGGTRLFAWLRENGYLIKRNGTDYNMPTQYSMELGLFEIKETSITHSDGHVTVQKTPKVTGKGQAYFVNKFLGE